MRTSFYTFCAGTILVLVVALTAGSANPLLAGQNGTVWEEDGDAGPLPGTAQTSSGSGALTEITGSLELVLLGFPDVGTDLENSDLEDLFLIRITDPAGFSADLQNADTTYEFDTLMMLFDANGYGVYYNDDHPFPDDVENGSFLSYLPTVADNIPTDTGPSTPGLYLLGVSFARNNPLGYEPEPTPENPYAFLDARIWQRISPQFDPDMDPEDPGWDANHWLKWHDVRAPDGPAAVDALSYWEAEWVAPDTWQDVEDVYPYGIELTGAEFVTQLPGDFDFDGDVDGTDFLVWQRGFGTEYNADDLATWQANFGPPASAAAAAAIPEPTSAGLLGAAMLLGSVGGIARWRRPGPGGGA